MFIKLGGPKWWRLYGLIALMIGLLFLEVRVHLTQTGHEAVELSLVLAGYGMIWGWLNANRQALMQEPERRDWREPPAEVGQRLGSWRSGLSFEAEHRANSLSRALGTNGRHAPKWAELAEEQISRPQSAGKGES